MKYKRILLKLSGEALMGNQEYGIDSQRLKDYATEIKKVVDLGCEVANCNRRRKYFQRCIWCGSRNGQSTR